MDEPVRQESLICEGRLPPERATAALAALNARSSHPNRRAFRELYLDAPDRLLQRAGVILRLRASSEGSTLSLMRLASSGKIIEDEDLRDERAEYDERVFPGAVPGRRIAAALGTIFGGPLLVEVQLEMSVEREEFAAFDARGNELDAVLQWRETGGANPVVLTECSLVDRKGRVAAFHDIADHLRYSCGMIPAVEPAEIRLLSQSGIRVPELIEGDDLDIRLDDRHIDAAWRVLRRQFGRALHNEPGARLGVDIEFLHDMRVATRRMRAALRIFRDAIPFRRRESFKRELKWLGGVLGDARDLDVHLLQLKKNIGKLEDDEPADPESSQIIQAMKFYEASLRKRRRTARSRMLRALDSKRYKRLADRVARFLDAGPPADSSAPGASRSAVEAAAETIHTALKKVVKAGRGCKPDSPDEELHRLRIKCKRLRYACEFYSDIFGEPALDFAKKVIEVQDVLGDHQDSVVARGEIASFADSTSAPRGHNRELFIGLGLMIAAEKERALNSRAEFFRVWKKFDSAKVRKPLETKIRKTLERRADM